MILDHRLSLRKGPVSPGPKSRNTSDSTDKPPPYTQSSLGYNSNKPLPATEASPPPQASPNLSAPLPYASASITSASSSRIAFQGVPHTPTTPTPHPPPTVNQVHLLSKKEDIVGTFYVDPSIPSLDPASKRKKHGKRGTPMPHASFQTHSGAISLSLATTGDVRVTPKATVAVSSKAGNVDIRLLPTPPSRPRIGLDITSRSGDVVVWLPETFSGVIHLNTRKGQLHVLPGLERVVKVLKSTDKEAMMLMGSATASDEAQTDLCQLSSRAGRLFVGLSGQDKLREEMGFWKKLTQFFKG